MTGALCLMGAGTKKVLGQVAVVAQDLEPRRPIPLFEPSIEFCTGLTKGLTMFVAVALDVIDGQEDKLALAAASTQAAIGANRLLAKGHTSLLIRGRMTLPMLINVCGIGSSVGAHIRGTARRMIHDSL